MRLVCTIDKSDESGIDPYAFSSYLKQNGVENDCEEVLGLHRIWVIDEDQYKKAQLLYEKYRKNPEDVPQGPPPRAPIVVKKKKHFFSTVILFGTIALFLWGNMTGGLSVPKKIPGVVLAPQLKGVVQLFAFDYPKYFQLRDELLKNEVVDNSLLLTMKATPFWNGAYELFVNHIKRKTPLHYSGPLFEKISQGEVWRLVTPALLHYDFIHILFNLLWFVILANQVEDKLGAFRFLVLIVLIAVGSNVAQYLMSGSFFMGLSGIVVGLAAFIWARQQVAPWEGYLLQKATLIFLGAFVLGIFGLQILFFLAQLYSSTEFNLPIANTAHLVGGGVGYLLGRMPIYRWKRAKE